MAITIVCTFTIACRHTRAARWKIIPPSAPLTQSDQHGDRPAHPINRHSPRGEEESQVWVRGPTCTCNNWFYLPGARERWLFDVLCVCWVACGILYTRYATC